MPFAITWHDKQRQRERDWERERERVEIVRDLYPMGSFPFHPCTLLGAALFSKGVLVMLARNFMGKKD